MLKINNVELNMDVFDADFSEKVEAEMEKVVKESKNSDNRFKQGGLKRSQYLKQQCKIIFDFFDNIWGEGTHKKIFEERSNLKECIIAFERFVNAYKEENEKEAKEMQELTAKYSPNRVQRRNKNNKRR
ncbi:DUF6673 family protein [uncultured Clostridium sp.]|uniref:DUF6673 family protein n=1 Tax=uncultured Clostridium sp. TaxID=59620 RepID=UPI00262CCC58|nr:DUF6673 family protein [uncultured Clostridium sp.]